MALIPATGGVLATVLAHGSEVEGLVYSASVAVGVAAAWLGIWCNRPRDRRTWVVLASGMTLLFGGDLLFVAVEEVVGEAPTSSLADVLYLAGSVLLAVGAVRFVRGRLGPHDVEGLVDTVAIVAVLLVVLWEPAIRPALDGPALSFLGRVVPAAYPVLDVLVVATLGRVLAHPRACSPSALLLAASMATLLAADTAYAVFVHSGSYVQDTSPAWLEAGWPLATALFAAAALHPSSARATDRVAGVEDHISTGRLVVSGLALLGGPVAWVAIEGQVDGQAGGPVAVLLFCVAVTTGAVLVRLGRIARLADRQRAAGAAREAYFRALALNSSDAVLVIDRAGRVIDTSPSVPVVLGQAESDVRGRSALDLVHPDDLDVVRSLLGRSLLAPGVRVTDEVRLRQPDGTTRWVGLSVLNLLGDVVVAGLVANLHDVTARKDAERRLAHQAFHDPLTGLANRALLHDRLSQALRTPGGGVGVLFLDLDRFKLVNDSLGHPAGDELLRVAASRLLGVAGPGDLVARLGGDEFALVVSGARAQLAVLGMLAQRCIEALRQPLDLWGTPVLFGASVGVAVAAPGATTAQELLRHADIAMYVAKGRGRNGWALFDSSMQSATLERLRLEADLRRALDEGQLELAYQPVVELATGELAGFEALVRWPHPTLGPLQPQRFIGIAEETGLIDELGGWVLREACADAAAWQLARPDGRPLQLSVNVSGRQVLGAELVTQVAAALLRSGLDPALLVLELTESVLVGDTPATAERLSQLRALGTRLAVDDFGTGYAALAYLGRFPLDILKIDRSFLELGGGEAELPRLVRGVLELGRALELETVAEGIENEAQRDLLRADGCRYGQGYLFSPPVDPATAARLAGAGPVVGRRAGWPGVVQTGIGAGLADSQ